MRWPTTARDALTVILIAAMLSLAANAMRSNSLPLLANSEYDILVPCPEQVGEATAIDVDAPVIQDPTSMLIDARSQAEYEQWHPPGAINQPFDWIAEQDEISRQAAEIARAIAKSGKHHVVVYGDGGNPDSGKHWAALLSASGIKNVVYISGGAKQLQQFFGPIKGGK